MENKEKIITGEWVKLKGTDGPAMLVILIDNRKNICCCWFTDKKEIQHKCFEEHKVERVK